MTLQFLEELCDELLQPDCERSAILTALSDPELKDAYVDVLHQCGLELVCGAYEHSSWMGDLLLIGANEGPIKVLRQRFSPSSVEFNRRGIDRPGQEQPR